MPDAYSHKKIKNPGCEKNAECGMRNWESIQFVFLPHSAFRIPHSAFRKPVAWATNAITEGRARFRIGTQWFSRSGCWNRHAPARPCGRGKLAQFSLLQRFAVWWVAPPWPILSVAAVLLALCRLVVFFRHSPLAASDPARAVQLMAADLGLAQQGFGDRVEAVQEPVALGFGDVEAILGSGRVGSVQRQGPGLEVDGDLRAAGLQAGRGDLLPLVLRKSDRKQTVVVSVAFE